jgi:hypothetical protein
MTLPRESWLPRLRDLMDGRPVRWAEAPNLLGDYDGRERTLEVFNADAGEQRGLLRRLRDVRKELEATAGGPVVVIFHTRVESSRLYGDFVGAALRTEATDDVAASDCDLPDGLPALALDVKLSARDAGRPGTGSKELPRVAA